MKQKSPHNLPYFVKPHRNELLCPASVPLLTASLHFCIADKLNTIACKITKPKICLSRTICGLPGERYEPGWENQLQVVLV